MNNRKSQRPIHLVGPTAVGKSAVALSLAGLVGGEIISVDSMQVYRNLNLGTAKPDRAEQARIPHHLIDVVDVTERFDTSRFVRLARMAADLVTSRGRTPVFCGGTGLYLKALLEGVGDAPPSDPALREELEKQPLADLLDELLRRDPVMHAGIDRRNPRRVVRAVEVIRLSGRPFSEQRASWSKGTPGHGDHLIFGLSREREDLRERIERRVDAMFKAGLVAETRDLLAAGLASNPTASQAIGYRQVIEHLMGERSLDETITLVKQQTRQFAKRQMTWFRRQLQVEWIEAKPADPADDLAARLAARIKEREAKLSVADEG